MSERIHNFSRPHATLKTLPDLLSRRVLFQTGGTAISSEFDAGWYNVRSYGDCIARVNVQTGERRMSPKPEHATQLKHWLLCEEHLKPVAGEPIRIQTTRRKPKKSVKPPHYSHAGLNEAVDVYGVGI